MDGLRVQSVVGVEVLEPDSPVRILAVDDEPALLDVYRQILAANPAGMAAARDGRARSRERGAFAPPSVTLCQQGDEAVEAVRAACEAKMPYAVAFVDIRMEPGPDGLWTIARIHELDPDVHVVVVTGCDDVSLGEITALASPRDKLYYLRKPFVPQEIQQLAAALSAKWRLERTLVETHATLEARVEQRTMALERLNETLRQDIIERHRAEEALRESEARLRRQNAALIELTRSKHTAGLDLHAALREIAEVSAETLAVDRVSVWLYEPDETLIRCVERYERESLCHSDGGVLTIGAHPEFFHALEENRVVAASDAATDPRTRDLYAFLGVGAGATSRLDSPIRIGGRTVGVITHEHVGGRRQWTLDEQTFAGSIADFAALTLEACDRRRKDDALRQLKRAVEQSIDGILVAEMGGTVLFANQAWADMHGLHAHDLAGSHLSLFHTQEQLRNQVLPLIERVSETGSHEGEVEHVRQDGSVLPTWMTVTLLRDDAENPMGILAIARDISHQKQEQRRRQHLEEQLLRSQKMEAVGRLAGGVAHDFNNMLMAIIGCSDFLLNALGENEPLRRDVEEIKKAGERAASLTRQLLAFSRRQVLQPRVLDLNEVVSDIEKMLRRVIGEDIELVTVLAPKVERIKADPGQLEQVIINLAINARDAMPDGGRLTLETQDVELDENYARDHVVVKPGRYVMLSVSDTGVGMDAETQTHIFEPFFTTKGPGKGTGLGLATVYGTVKQSDGYIWVYSELGQGTTFKLYFPRVEGGTEGGREETPQSEDLRGEETILLVEDDEVVRDLVHRILLTYGYRILVAPSARKALDLSREHEGPIDLMLTDVVMPQMSGRELAIALESIRPGLKVIYMSGYSNEAVVRHGVLDAGKAFLQKPFTPIALARKLREILDAGAR